MIIRLITHLLYIFLLLINFCQSKLSIPANGFIDQKVNVDIDDNIEAVESVDKNMKCDDGVVIPEWIENNENNSNKTLQRYKRRFLQLYSGSTLNVQIVFYVALESFSDDTSLSLTQQLAYLFPLTNPYLEPFTGYTTGIGREMHYDRFHVFREIEEFFINRVKIKGKECLLRIICDLSDQPMDHGMFGDVINFIFTPSKSSLFHEVNEYNDYIGAEYLGKNLGSCDQVYHCQLPVLDLLTSLE